MSFIPRQPTDVKIGRPGWAEDAIDVLCEVDDIIVSDPRTGREVYVDGSTLNPRRPVWGQLRKILKDAGISVPRARWRR